jgi:hypothetical protein
MSMIPDFQVPKKFKPATRNALSMLEAELGSKQKVGAFLLDAMLPFAEAQLGQPVPRSLAKSVLVAFLDDVYSDEEVIPDEPPTPAPAPAKNDFDGLAFRNSQDCRNWPVTVQISNVRIEGNNIAWDEAKGQREARKWNVKTGKKSVNGETILLIPRVATAGMFDFLGVGQTRKTLGNIRPSSEGPGFFPGWVPQKGELVGFCIATISRDKSAARMQERSNVVWFNWP